MRKNKNVFIAAVAAVSMLMGTTAFAAIDGEKTAFTVNGETADAGTFGAYLRYCQASNMYYYQQMYASFGVDMGSLFWDSNAKSDSTETIVETETEAAEDHSFNAKIEEQLGEAETVGEGFRNSAIKNLADMMLLEQHKADYGVDITDDEKKALKEAAKLYWDSNDETVFTDNGATIEDVERFMELFTLQTRVEEAAKKSFEVEVNSDDYLTTTISFAEFTASDFMPQETFEESTEEETETETEDVVDYDAMAKEAADELLEQLRSAENPAEFKLQEAAEALDERVYTSTFSFTCKDDVLGLYEDQAKKVRNLFDGEFVDEVMEVNGIYYVVRMDALSDNDATETKKKALEAEERDKEYKEMLADWEEAADLAVDKDVVKDFKVVDSVMYTVKPPENVKFEKDSEAATEAVTE